MNLTREIRTLTHDFVRHGGKTNRRKQRERMLAFGAFAASSMGARAMQEVGKKHVIAFYRTHRDQAERTKYAYFLAIRELWKLAGKPSEPPTPR